MPHLQQAEFSRPFSIERLGAVEVTQTIEASPDELVRLARRLGLVALERLSALIRLRPAAGTAIIHVSGRLEADIIQTCVVTLEPFPSHVEDSFEADFTRAQDAALSETEFDLDHEPPEPIPDGIIDMGELVAQFLSLALDPHPRAPGAALHAVYDGSGDPVLSPFAVLGGLKPN